jgi:CubicO group peptidase (beta-lactamase class C family)
MSANEKAPFFSAALLLWSASSTAFCLSYPVLKDFLGDPRYPDDFWQVSSPESEGMDSRKLQAALDFIRSSNAHVHSFLIVRHGRLVLEQYGADYSPSQIPYVRSSDAVQQTPDVRHHLWSTTKTVLSALVGIAISEGRIPGVKARVMDWFKNDCIDDMDADKQQLTIENLLTMQSGLDFDEESEVAGLLFFSTTASALSVLGRSMSFQPGTEWYYTSGNSQVLAEILRRATGRTPLEYAKEKLFSRIGITTCNWVSDMSGTQLGGFGLSLRPRDLARFGYLYLKGGKWGDTQVVPGAWVKESTMAHVSTPWPDGRYGYHCWIPYIGGWATRGHDGQMMYVFPDRDLIVVFTADIPSRNGYATWMEDFLVGYYVLAALRAG